MTEIILTDKKNGMKTLLLGEEKALGGLMTIGELNFIDMCESRDGTLLTQGFFQEFYDAVDGSVDLLPIQSYFFDQVNLNNYTQQTYINYICLFFYFL